LDELAELQAQKVLMCAQDIIPKITTDDVLQPVDFPQLESHPYFRYEEGVLEGIRTVRAALFAYYQDSV